jgi:2'-5' RNA ligase
MSRLRVLPDGIWITLVGTVASPLSAYKINALQEMGIEVSKLGCVMLDLEPIDAAAFAPSGWAYYAKNPEYKWVKGFEVQSHITLLYGLLKNANTIRWAIDEVLEGWEPGEIAIDRIGSFPSNLDGEPYACIIGHIRVTAQLLDAHARLSYLPHIDTFWDYKPHVTLGYVHEKFEQDAIQAFLEAWPEQGGWTLTPKGLNYGWLPDEH